MWTAVKFAIKRAKSTKSHLTTISFIENVSDGMMLTTSTESILNKDLIENEKIKQWKRRANSDCLIRCTVCILLTVKLMRAQVSLVKSLVTFGGWCISVNFGQSHYSCVMCRYVCRFLYESARHS